MAHDGKQATAGLPIEAMTSPSTIPLGAARKELKTAIRRRGVCRGRCRLRHRHAPEGP